MRREPGEQILVQEIWRDEVWAGRPMMVVQDRDDRVALWFPKGTLWKAPTVPSTRPREASRAERLATCLACGEWVFADAEWDVSTLVLVRPGDAAHVREEGLRVVGRAARNESPFDEGWPDWRPDLAWPLPELPEGWEKRCR